MTIATASAPAPANGTLAPFASHLFRIGVGQYHDMIERGILGPDDDVELLEGLLVRKMSKNDPHIYSTEQLRDVVGPLLPAGWIMFSQNPVTTDDSEPEPDASVVRGRRLDYRTRKPGAADTGMLAEVADTSLERDRAKCRIYARAGFPVYWIVNLVDRIIEVYTRPQGTGDEADYQSRQDYHETDSVPLVLDGVEIGRVAVRDILP